MVTDLEAIRKFTVDQRHELEKQPGYFSHVDTAPVTPMETALAHLRDLLDEVERLRHKAGECACDSRASQYGWDDVQCVWKVRDNEKKMRCEFCGGVHIPSGTLLDVPIVTCPKAPPGLTFRSVKP